MDNHFREKFEKFAPEPPEHIWNGIENELARKPFYFLFLNNWKTFSAAILLLLFVALGTWYFLPSKAFVADDTFYSEEKTETILFQPEQADEISDNSTIQANKAENKSEIIENQEINSSNRQNSENATDNFDSEINIKSTSAETIDPILTSESIHNKNEQLNNQDENTDLMSIQNMHAKNISFYNQLKKPAINGQLNNELVKPNEPGKSPKGSWSTCFYVSPEIIFKDFDSVRMLNTYSFNIEPTYYINNHWFVRFGAGISSVRDRGFAKLDFISNELMGTYDDVYDVSFETIDGKPVPTFYTKVTEVWDSVRRLEVSEVTNQYLYLQTPLLLGYYKKSSNFNWYFLGGPAINFLVYKKIEAPVENYENITIIDLQNNLPTRSPYYFQLWLGAGIEYNVGKHFSFSIEPNYRYYFTGVFDDSAYKSGFSGFALRFGLVYKIF